MKAGLCAPCGTKVHFETSRKVQIVKESLDLAYNGKTAATRVSRCDLAAQIVEELMPLEAKGITISDPPPSVLLVRVAELRERILLNESAKLAEKAILKSSVAVSAGSKVTALNSASIKIAEFIKSHSGDPSLIAPIVANLMSLAHKAQLDGFLDEARKAEFKGNRKKAIDRYQEALFFLRNDRVGDHEQLEEIRRIENKILDLGREP